MVPLRLAAAALLLSLGACAAPASAPAAVGTGEASAPVAAPSAAAEIVPLDAFPDVARAYWVEIDGRPTWAGQPDLPLPMASLAKLMTALVIAEDGGLDQDVTISAGTAQATGTRLGLRPGERYLAGDLFTAMLVRSANDACRALADWKGGDLASFVARMNARAAELGLHHTRFANACGHDAPGQASTVRDLAVLARAALAQPRIAADARRTRFTLRSRTGREFAMNTTNALLAQVPGAIGLKTGYTPGAGRCLVAVAERDGHEVLVVLLHAPDRWWDTVGLLELAFDEARRPAPP